MISPRERGWIIATVMLGTVSTITAATIINVAFPALIAEFHVGHDSLQWVAAGFLGAMTTTMLATAWLVETHGQRRTFIAALAIFLASSALGAASFNPEVLIASRVLQGAAAGILQPLAMIALFEVFPPERRGSAMGLFGLGIVLVPAIGPSIGGILLESFGWRSIFLLPLPFCLAGLALGWRFLPGPHAGAPRTRFDWAGFVLLAATLASLLSVPVVGHRAGWTSVQLTVIAVWTLLLLAGFIAWEFRAPAPLLALRLFAGGGFRATALVALAYGLGLFGTTYLIPVFVQDVAGYSPSRAGALLIIPGLGLAVTIALAGRWTDRVEPRRIVIARARAVRPVQPVAGLRRPKHRIYRPGHLAADRPHRIGHDHSGAFGGRGAGARRELHRLRRLVGQFRPSARRRHRRQSTGGPARMAAGRARRGRRGNGLSRMLLGGYDCVCGRDCGRLVDPQASTGQR